MNRDFLRHLEKKLKVKILSVIRLYGGCINKAYKLETLRGHYFVKFNSSLNLFSSEEKGLVELKLSKTFYTPEVIMTGRYVGTYYIIMEFIEPDNIKDNFWELFGQKLAILHKSHKDRFGLEYDNSIGFFPQINSFEFESVDFFINARILPQLKILENRLSVNLYSDFCKLFKLLPDIMPLEKASLIHGDLWNGNYLVNKHGYPTLIDPAIYYGSREVDIAMTKLFGGFPQKFYNSYNLEFPLVSNWQERLDIWNLYPLLVHANLFGANYISQIQTILKRFSN